jgi:hypothetical protein
LESVTEVAEVVTEEATMVETRLELEMVFEVTVPAPAKAVRAAVQVERLKPVGAVITTPVSVAEGTMGMVEEQ